MEPKEAFYTTRYMRPTDIYVFKGEDLGLDYDVLVRTANPVENFDNRVDRIKGTRTEEQFVGFHEGKKEFTVYDLEELPPEIQSKVFDLMEIDWKAEEMVKKLM